MRQSPQYINSVGPMRYPKISAGGQSGRAAGRRGRQIDDIADVSAKVGAQQANVCVTRAPQRALPLNPNRVRLVGATLANQFSHNPRGGAPIEFVEVGAQLPI